MKKRLPAALLALSLTLALTPISALAADHQFRPTTDDLDDDWVCTDCGATITANLKEGYDAALTLDGRTLPKTEQQTEGAIQRYLEQLAEETLEPVGWYMTTVDKLSYTAPGSGRDGTYRYTVTVQSFGRSGNPLLTEVTTPAMTLTVPSLTQPSQPSLPVQSTKPSQTTQTTQTDGKDIGSGGWNGINTGTGNWTNPVPGYTGGWNKPLTGYTGIWSSGNYSYKWNMNVPLNKDYETLNKDNMMQVFWYAWITSNRPDMGFTDVTQDSWFYRSVNYVWSRGLMSGLTDDTFGPDVPTDRAMVWTVLARMNGVSIQPQEGEAWYEPARAWAVRSGLTDGSNPLGTITREYLAEMLWKCAGGRLVSADLSGYPDREKVSSYAANGVNWAVANGVLQGSDGLLAPQGSVTRAELATMVMRYGSTGA